MNLRKLFSYVLLIPYWIWLSLVFLTFLITSSLASAILILVLGKKAHVPMMWVYKCWSATFFMLAFIPVRVKNRATLRKNLPCIVVSNHGSNLDMFIGAYVLPPHTKPLAKVQLKKMPLLGFLFSTVCVLVDRSSKDSREKGSRLMLEEVQRGNSLFLYPEGTRNKGKEPLNPFYDGAFRFAIESGKPIVAMCTINARSVSPSDNYSVRPGIITVEYLGPYPTKHLKKENLEELKQQVFADMYEVIKREDRMFRS
jgi:1-acyl-sn-glycerol-3-phosphate acyltransferase